MGRFCTSLLTLYQKEATKFSYVWFLQRSAFVYETNFLVFGLISLGASNLLFVVIYLVFIFVLFFIWAIYFGDEIGDKRDRHYNTIQIILYTIRPVVVWVRCYFG